jgi:hypothetical protein
MSEKEELLSLIFTLISEVSPNGWEGLNSNQEDRALEIDAKINKLYGDPPTYG